jgi:hypothetical protein
LARGSPPSAVRYKNWKIYYKIAEPGPAGWIGPLVDWHFPLIQNIKRDPFTIPGFRKAITEEQRMAITETILEHLKLCRWQFSKLGADPDLDFPEFGFS